MASSRTLHDWVRTLPEAGRYVFTRSEAEAASDASRAAVRATLRRLNQTGALVSPRRGFYVVVPPEYRSAGCPPATWFIDDLMRHLGRSYYVSLLTAAVLHGAGHQRPMTFQVVADAAERSVVAGRVRIEFHVSRLVGRVETTRMQTETGHMIVATPETTAFDLVRFPAAAGSWSNVATVVAELAERVDPNALAAAAKRVRGAMSNDSGGSSTSCRRTRSPTRSRRCSRTSASRQRSSARNAPAAPRRSTRAGESWSTRRSSPTFDSEGEHHRVAAFGAVVGGCLRRARPRLVARARGAVQPSGHLGMRRLPRRYRASQALLPSSQPLLRGHRSRTAGRPPDPATHGGDPRRPRSLARRTEMEGRTGSLHAHVSLRNRVRAGRPNESEARDHHARALCGPRLRPALLRRVESVVLRLRGHRLLFALRVARNEAPCALLRTGLEFDVDGAWSRVHRALVARLPGDPWRGDRRAR